MATIPLHISAEALFRYQWVAELEARVLSGESLSVAISDIRRRPRPDPQGGLRCVSRRSLYRWYRAYRSLGVSGLEPKQRHRIASSRVLSSSFTDFLRLAKDEDPDLSIPDLIELARERCILGDEQCISRTTVWRTCLRMGIPVSRRQRLKTSDTRRFSYPHRMMMVLSDGKHFRAGVQRLKRVALTFLDDATRFGLGIIVGTSESTELFLTGLHQVLMLYGLMNALFLDHGAGFISNDTKRVVARLGRQLIHGQVRYPQGHGKIERYHRTLIHKELRTYPGNPEVDADCGSLSLRLNHWLRERYNHRPHESLGGDTPSQRWHNDSRNLELPADRAWLDSQFLTTNERTVSNDHVVSLGGVLYEVPQECEGRISIERHLLTGRRTVCVGGEDKEIHVLDAIRNAFDRRARPQPTTKEHENSDSTNRQEAKSKTASSKAFSEAFGSILGPEGDFPKQEEEE